MPETAPFTIGADAGCTVRACGKVSRVVVDPVARAVTHLVVRGVSSSVPAFLSLGGRPGSPR